MFAQLQSRATAVAQAAEAKAREAALNASKAAQDASAQVQKHASEMQASATEAASAIAANASEMSLTGLASGLTLTGSGPSEHCVDFPDGPLGFDLEGARVTSVEPGAQAAQLGVQVGDVLSAVAGELTPQAPPELSAADGELKVRKLLRKRIKDKPRPVQLTFTRAPPAKEDTAISGVEPDSVEEILASLAGSKPEATAEANPPAEEIVDTGGWDDMDMEWPADDASNVADDTSVANTGVAEAVPSKAAESTERALAAEAECTNSEEEVAQQPQVVDEDAAAEAAPAENTKTVEEAATKAATEAERQRGEAEAAANAAREEEERTKAAELAAKAEEEQRQRSADEEAVAQERIVAAKAEAEAEAERKRIEVEEQDRIEEAERKQAAKQAAEAAAEEERKNAAEEVAALAAAEEERAKADEQRRKVMDAAAAAKAAEEAQAMAAESERKKAEAQTAQEAVEAAPEQEQEDDASLHFEDDVSEHFEDDAAAEGPVVAEANTDGVELHLEQQECIKLSEQLHMLKSQLDENVAQLNTEQIEAAQYWTASQSWQEQSLNSQAEVKMLREQLASISDGKGSVDEQFAEMSEKGLQIEKAHNAEKKRCEELSSKTDAMKKDMHSLAEQLSQSRNTLKTQQEQMEKDSKALQEKALGAVQRVKEQGEKKVETAMVELREAQVESQSMKRSQHLMESELNQACTKTSSLAQDLSAAERTAADRWRTELMAAMEHARKAERDLEQSRVEIKELSNSSLQRNDRVEVAHTLLAGKVNTMQQQVDNAKGDYDIARQRATVLTEELNASKAENREFSLAARNFEEERKLDLDSFECQAQVLEAEVARLREALSTSQACVRTCGEDAAKQAADAELRAGKLLNQLAQKNLELTDALAKVAAAEAKASSTAAELEELRNVELIRQRDEMEARAETESHRQLIRALQERLAGQETTEAELRHELEDLVESNRSGTSGIPIIGSWLSGAKAAAESESDEDAAAEGHQSPGIQVFNMEKEGEADAEGEDSCKSGAARRPVEDACADASPPENAGREEVIQLHDRIGFLEKRCRTMQKKLDARPIVYNGPPTFSGDNPLGLELGAAGQATSGWESWLRNIGVPPPLASCICGCTTRVEQPLRFFTQRLLQKDAWLLVFYAHLIVLYLLVASCFAGSAPDVMNQAPAAFAEAQLKAAAKASSQVRR